ncbi:YceI family protein [Dictyobacter aurantiacus]|uniref:YceI family protein n=1 Tax=Dictyobacter aurantiacus TaxID=1936993 RepID=UPI0013594F06|nr:YceI family protein [Dictyobacter aurantiacus]
MSTTKCITPGTGGLRSFSIVPAQSTASYKVHENLILRNLPSIDAVGKTQDVTGSFKISSSPAPQVTSLHLTVNLSTLQTDEPMRDRFVRNRALETNQYPNADFTSTCAQGMPAHYSDGQSLSFQLPGSLTMHGKTHQETFAVTGKLIDKTISGTATTTLLMTDFDIQPPDLANIAIAQNKVLVTITFLAQEK